MSLERVGERLGRREPTGTAERPVSLSVGRLGPDWRVLHEVSVGRDHPVISHVVIGPAGVFSLLVRRHPVWRRRLVPERVQIHVSEDELLVDGRGMPYIPQARVQAWRTARALSAAVGEEVRVRPAVVIAGCEDITFHAVPAKVDVLARRHVARWLAAFPDAKVPVPQVYAAARRSEVWKFS
ncbi:MAG: hypothetical protein ACT4QG_16740 [Sporichthyaceae bacterium]